MPGNRRSCALDDEPIEPVDLAAYLDRLDYRGPLVPSLALLSRLVRRHVDTIPVVAVEAGQCGGADLAPATVDQKLLVRRVGGNCFEHASLLRRALRAIGFSVEQHLARAWLAGAARPAASHTSLKVIADERLWLVDTGFGTCRLDEPLRWCPARAQETAAGSFRLIATGDGYMLQRARRGGWAALYEILDPPCRAEDFDIACDLALREALPRGSRASDRIGQAALAAVDSPG
jgi:N-hydroxyarylamine O-acetyltransferase